MDAAKNGRISDFDDFMYKYLHGLSTGICQDLLLSLIPLRRRREPEEMNANL